MRKLVSIFAAIMLASAPCFAQSSNEVSISYGQFTINQIATTVGLVIGSAASAGNISDIRSTGSFGLEYYCHIGNGKCAFGGGLNFESTSYKVGNKTNPDNLTNERINIFSIIPGFKVAWVGGSAFTFYSKIAAGVALYANNSTTVNLAFQLSPACIEFGSPSFLGFIEAGFGTQGIVNVGIRFPF